MQDTCERCGGEVVIKPEQTRACAQCGAVQEQRPAPSFSTPDPPYATADLRRGGLVHS